MTLAREMFFEGQDFIKEELIKRFPIEDFSRIDYIIHKEEEEKEEEKGGNNPIDSINAQDLEINVEDTVIVEAQEEGNEDPRTQYFYKFEGMF